jgi:dinuclear metal center YbgI/SA1388 family protein
MGHVKLNKITNYLNSYLSIDDFSDDSWNGLQFEGTTNVKHLATAVDASIDSFSKASQIKADLLLVHHGQFWKAANPSLAGWQKQRVDQLYRYNISVYAAHLPLDKHKVVGNNAQLLKLLGASITSDFHKYGETTIGWIGKLKPTPLETIVSKLNSKLNTACHVVGNTKSTISTIAVCSGGGAYSGFFDALNDKVDLYLTGDPVYVEPTAKDANINIVFAGHYYTETLGVKALGKHLAKKFSLKHTFLDLPPSS